MGLRGPLPTPLPILKARGSDIPDRKGPRGRQDAPEPPAEAPTCPARLGKEAKAEWKRQVKELLAMGCIAKLDRAMLAIYCATWGEWVATSQRVEEEGILVTDDGVLLPHPMLKARDAAAAQVIKLATHFGFSPSARARLKAPEKKQEANDPDGINRLLA